MNRDRKASGVPTRCLEDHPNCKTIRLAGRYISLAKLEDNYGLDHGYVSYILQGKRTPTLTYAKNIAIGLGILDCDGKPDVNGLITAIADRKEELEAAFKNRISA